jgi:putative heme degradation protein
MIEPFGRPSNEGSPTAEEACSGNVKCKFCAILHRARELEPFDPLPELCSPLTPGVQRVNLSYSDDGQILHVHLGRDWKRMFEQLPLIGEGVVMTRNEAAILGRRMTFPELAFTTRGTKGASGQGGLWFDFRALAAARAVHLRCESGHIFGIEFADATGATIHRFTATKASDLDSFLCWVRLHQACSGRRSAAGEQERRLKVPTGDGDALVPLFVACCEHRLRVNAAVHTSAVVQRACFIPQSLQAVDDWWFVSDDLVGLHFCTAQLTRARIDRRLSGRDPRLRFYSHAKAPETALVLESSDESQAGTWRELVQSIA